MTEPSRQPAAADASAAVPALRLSVALRALRSVRYGMPLAAAFGIALSIVPLFGVFGVESAWALGALLPPLCGALGAEVAIRARGEASISGWVIAERALLGALCVLICPLVVIALNALRVKACAPLEGLTFIALGPGAGVVLAALLGACVGATRLRPWLACTLAALMPFADSLRAVYDFYATPSVFAYGHFFGYFPGSMYDELIAVPWPLMTLRWVSACAFAGMLALLGGHYAPQLKRLRFRPLAGHRALLAVSVPSALIVALCGATAPALGHRASLAHIEEVLGGQLRSARCELIVPRELRRERRRRLADDCDYRVQQIERWLGVRQPKPVRVLLFRSADEKRSLMGAASTNIAKPWRHEIYLQDDSWPHPVLAHELAHAIASNVGVGPLRVAGRFGGLWPDFALIEGLAVAAAWSDSASAGLTPYQWSRAMLELDLLPALSDLFGAGFLAQQRRLAYTVSGSLLRFIAERHGTVALRRIYQSGDIARTLGIPLPKLEQEFRAFLRTVPLPDSALALARQRFLGKSILSGICPHEKARLRQTLEGQLAADDRTQAERTCDELLAIDEKDVDARAVLVAIKARRGLHAAANAELEKLSDQLGENASIVAATRHALADESWRAGQPQEALVAYRTLLRGPLDRDSLRVLQVKTLALERSAREQQLVFGLLVGEPGQSIDGASAVYHARELRALRSDGLPEYLEARQLLNRERFAAAAALLHDARGRSLPTPELDTEALRIEAEARAGAGELDTSIARFNELLARTDVPLGVRAEAEDWLARLRWLARKR